ncbi:hypothetical protein D9758_010324 [Tetrapyrgos nigripes]|uniref:F-box domain-containing protein n=1 Tax=Tetrapyrgos nigripes TaxID=182062 RepID=A0A8H5LL67_9AGAR|nr:hypothetical protein D9758_010324 [Tetrapyrgos nigripes]
MGVAPFDDFQSLIHPISANATPPIHILPPELLLSIFQLTIDITTAKPRPSPTQPPLSLPEPFGQPQLCLILVCQRWKNIVEGSPGLWRDVVICTTTMGADASTFGESQGVRRWNPQALDRLLSRSISSSSSSFTRLGFPTFPNPMLPINITINDPFNRLPSSIWQVIFMREHVKRWRRVEVVMDSERIGLFSARSPSQGCSVQRRRGMEIEMPFLECLKLKFVHFGGYNFYLDSGSDRNNLDLELFANAPRLRHVSIIDNAGCTLGNPATQADDISITTTATTTTTPTTAPTTDDNHTETQARGFTFILPWNQLEKLECGGRFIPPVPTYMPTSTSTLSLSSVASAGAAEEGVGDRGVDEDGDIDMDVDTGEGITNTTTATTATAAGTATATTTTTSTSTALPTYTYTYPDFTNLTELAYTLDIPSTFFSVPAPAPTHPHPNPNANNNPNAHTSTSPDPTLAPFPNLITLPSLQILTLGPYDHDQVVSMLVRSAPNGVSGVRKLVLGHAWVTKGVRGGHGGGGVNNNNNNNNNNLGAGADSGLGVLKHLLDCVPDLEELDIMLDYNTAFEELWGYLGDVGVGVGVGGDVDVDVDDVEGGQGGRERSIPRVGPQPKNVMTVKNLKRLRKLSLEFSGYTIRVPDGCFGFGFGSATLGLGSRVGTGATANQGPGVGLEGIETGRGRGRGPRSGFVEMLKTRRRKYQGPDEGLGLTELHIRNVPVYSVQLEEALRELRSERKGEVTKDGDGFVMSCVYRE